MDQFWWRREMTLNKQRKIVEYLESVRKVQSQMNSKNTEFKYISIEDFILKEGKFFSPDPSIPVSRGEMKSCFKSLLFRPHFSFLGRKAGRHRFSFLGLFGSLPSFFLIFFPSKICTRIHFSLTPLILKKA